MHLYVNDFNTWRRVRTPIIIDFDEAHRCENENQGSILRRVDDEFLHDVRTHLTVGCMPTAKRVLLTNVHYTATTAAHEYTV